MNQVSSYHSSLNHARAQQLAAAAHIIAGGPDQRGAVLGLFDSYAEEYIMEQEHADAQRFEWWFTETAERAKCRSNVICRSSERWTPDDWRAAIDKQMKEEQDGR